MNVGDLKYLKGAGLKNCCLQTAHLFLHVLQTLCTNALLGPARSRTRLCCMDSWRKIRRMSQPTVWPESLAKTTALHVMGADEQSCQHMPPRWTCDSQPSTFASQKGDVKTGSCESYGLVADVKRECVSNTTRLFFLRLIRKQSRKRAPIHWIDSWNSGLAWKGLERKRLPQLNFT